MIPKRVLFGGTGIWWDRHGRYFGGTGALLVGYFGLLGGYVIWWRNLVGQALGWALGCAWTGTGWRYGYQAAEISEGIHRIVG
ncbi:MAG: hypothetical protein KTR17_09910 [Cellvibrionaceae bacterium]|nr:hypothetical protein [Cellvibrionaceae bacterium]